GAIALACPNLAEAQGMPAGVQTSPPGATGPAPQAPTQDLRQRRAIRGCPVGVSCQGPIQDALLEFERETFPEPGSKSPWVEGDSPNGHASVRMLGRSGDRINAPGSRGKSRS